MLSENAVGFSRQELEDTRKIRGEDKQYSINPKAATAFIQELCLRVLTEPIEVREATTLLRSWGKKVLDCRLRFPARLRSIVWSVKKIQRAFRCYLWKRNSKLERILNHWKNVNNMMTDEELTARVMTAISYVQYVQQRGLYATESMDVQRITRNLMDEKKKRTYDVNLMMEVIFQKYIEAKQLFSKQLKAERVSKGIKQKKLKFMADGGLQSNSNKNSSSNENRFSGSPLFGGHSPVFDAMSMSNDHLLSGVMSSSSNNLFDGEDPLAHMKFLFDVDTFDYDDALHRYEALWHADMIRKQQASTEQFEKMLESSSKEAVVAMEGSFSADRFNALDESTISAEASFLALSNTLVNLEESLKIVAEKEEEERPDGTSEKKGTSKSLSRKQSTAAINALKHVTNQSSPSSTLKRKKSIISPFSLPQTVKYDDLSSTGARVEKMLWCADLTLYYRVRAARMKYYNDKAHQMAEQHRQEEAEKLALLSNHPYLGKRRGGRSPAASPMATSLTPRRSPHSMTPLTPRDGSPGTGTKRIMSKPGSASKSGKRVTVVSPRATPQQNSALTTHTLQIPLFSLGDEEAPTSQQPKEDPSKFIGERRETLRPSQTSESSIQKSNPKKDTVVSVLVESQPTKTMKSEQLKTTTTEDNGILTVETVKEVTTTTLIRTLEQSMSQAELDEAKRIKEEEDAAVQAAKDAIAKLKAKQTGRLPFSDRRGKTLAPAAHEVSMPHVDRHQLFHHKLRRAPSLFDYEQKLEVKPAKLKSHSPHQANFSKLHAKVHNKPMMDRSLVNEKMTTLEPSSPARVPAPRPGSAASNYSVDSLGGIGTGNARSTNFAVSSSPTVGTLTGSAEFKKLTRPTSSASASASSTIRKSISSPAVSEAALEAKKDLRRPSSAVQPLSQFSGMGEDKKIHIGKGVIRNTGPKLKKAVGVGRSTLARSPPPPPTRRPDSRGQRGDHQKDVSSRSPPRSEIGDIATGSIVKELRKKISEERQMEKRQFQKRRSVEEFEPPSTSEAAAKVHPSHLAAMKGRTSPTSPTKEPLSSFDHPSSPLQGVSTEEVAAVTSKPSTNRCGEGVQGRSLEEKLASTVTMNATTTLLSSMHRPASAVSQLLRSVEGSKLRKSKESGAAVAAKLINRRQNYFSDEAIARRKSSSASHHNTSATFKRPKSALASSLSGGVESTLLDRQDGVTAHSVYIQDKLPTETQMEKLQKLLLATPKKLF